VLSWALAAWPVSKVLGDALVRLAFHSNLAFLFQLQGLFIWLAVSVLFSVVASFLPAWSASQITVREALTMSKQPSLVTLVIVILISAALALGGARWLCHPFLKMHGLR
jgi:hypothetical protein